MKRALDLLDDAEPVLTVRWFRVGRDLVQVADAVGGSATSSFASELVAGGAVPYEPRDAETPDLRLVIRGASATREARAAQTALEAEADVVLGSARASFAARLLRSRLGD